MLNKIEFRSFVEKVLKENKTPGAAVGIIKNGEVILCEGYGLSDVENEIKVDPKTVFAIGSSTKSFAAEAIGILVDEGKLELDKLVKYYISEFEMYDNYATNNLTVRDMLCHRCGLPRHDILPYGNESLSLEGIVKSLKYLKPNVSFRGKFQYQNHMYTLASYLIERVTGKKWYEFIEEKILSHLDMNDTNFSVDDSKKLENKALPYNEIDDNVVQIPFYKEERMGAAGAINSNIEDMLKWVELNLNKGFYNGTQVRSESSITECHTPQKIAEDFMPIKFEENDFGTYGLGWYINTFRGHKVIQHGGNVVGFSAMVSFIPEINSGFVVLTNKNSSLSPRIIQYQLYDLLLGYEGKDWNETFTSKMKELMEKYSQGNASNQLLTGTKPSVKLENYKGKYVHPAYGEVEIVFENEELFVKYGVFSSKLQHICLDVFGGYSEVFSATIPIKFIVSIMGDVTDVEINLEPAIEEEIKFTKVQ